jgi:hypothetical protein
MYKVDAKFDQCNDIYFLVGAGKLNVKYVSPHVLQNRHKSTSFPDAEIRCLQPQNYPNFFFYSVRFFKGC